MTGGIYPASHERSNQPSLYDQLFTGFADLAALHGTVVYGPLDSTLETGRDGTITPDGKPARGYDYHVPTDKLPPSLREKGLIQIDVKQYPSVIMGDEVWSENVWVTLYEANGMKKEIKFSKDPGTSDIRARSSIEASEQNESIQAEDLSEEQQIEILKELFEGQRYLLDLEGSAGDYARKVHLALTLPDEPDMDDIELVSTVLAELTVSFS